MKINWGTGILIVIILFLLAVAGFFIFINNLDINMVEDNYYEKELIYQEKIDKINNTLLLDGEINLVLEPNLLLIQFPELDSTLQPQGMILLYRPSDPKKDLTLALHLNEDHQQAVDISGIDKGRWIVKIDWIMGDKEYYFEKGIIISF